MSGCLIYPPWKSAQLTNFYKMAGAGGVLREKSVSCLGQFCLEHHGSRDKPPNSVNGKNTRSIQGVFQRTKLDLEKRWGRASVTWGLQCQCCVRACVSRQKYNPGIILHIYKLVFLMCIWVWHDILGLHQSPDSSSSHSAVPTGVRDSHLTSSRLYGQAEEFTKPFDYEKQKGWRLLKHPRDKLEENTNRQRQQKKGMTQPGMCHTLKQDIPRGSWQSTLRRCEAVRQTAWILHSTADPPRVSTPSTLQEHQGQC